MHSWFLFGLGVGLFALSCVFPFIASKYESKQLRAYLAVMDGVLTFASLYLCIVGFGNSLWGGLLVVITFLYVSYEYGQVMGPDFHPYGVVKRNKKEQNKSLDQRLINLNETIQARLEQYPPGTYDDPALWKLLKDMDGIIKEWS